MLINADGNCAKLSEQIHNGMINGATTKRHNGTLAQRHNGAMAQRLKG